MTPNRLFGGWRLSPSLALASSLLPSLEQQLTYLQHELIAAASGPVDQLYSRFGLVNGKFFPEGWGNLGVVNLQEDIKLMQSWPPPGLKIEWKRIDAGTRDGVAYKLFEGSFRTPCVGRVYDALPPESRMGRVQLLVPHSQQDSVRAADHAGLGAAPAAALHLAATGDQGFGRRLRLAFPLLKQGVCSLVHESPFYGSRRPEAQKGTKLLRVSDLLALGWATIYESTNLLHWLTLEGYQEGGLCMTGLSMGGVHSCMTSALYPHDVATAALLAPRSAAVAYCDGALSAAMAWQPLLKEADEANNNVLKVINSAAQPVDVMREATYALAELELAWEVASSAGGGVSVPMDRPSGLPIRQDISGGAAGLSRTTGLDVPSPLSLPMQGEVPGASGRTPEQLTRKAAAAAVEAVSEVAAWLRAGGLQSRPHTPASPAAHDDHPHDAHPQHVNSTSHPAPNQTPRTHTHTHRDGTYHMSSSHHCHDIPLARSHKLGTSAATPHQEQEQDRQGVEITPVAQVRAVTPPLKAATPPSKEKTASSSFSLRSLSETQELNKVVSRLVAGLSELKQLSLLDEPMERQKTVRRLKHVLETYTDITRFPLPRRPDAAIFMAATHDEYVTTESVRQLSEYWAGSEMRLVSGGHVTGFLMHQDKFRNAIVDSIRRLKQPKPQSS